MRKTLGFYKNATEAFHEGLIPEVLNGKRDGRALLEGEQFFAGLRVLRQQGMHLMVMWLFSTNKRFLLWQHKTMGSVDELLLSDCESIEFGGIHETRVDIVKLFKILPIAPVEELQIRGEVDHIVRNGDSGQVETWYLRDQKSTNTRRLVDFISDSFKNAGINSHRTRISINPQEKMVSWISALSLGFGILVGLPALWLSDRTNIADPQSSNHKRVERDSSSSSDKSQDMPVQSSSEMLPIEDDQPLNQTSLWQACEQDADVKQSSPQPGEKWWPVIGPKEALEDAKVHCRPDAYVSSRTGNLQIASFRDQSQATQFAEQLSSDRNHPWTFKVGEPRIVSGN